MAIRVALHHRTTYTYDRPVQLGPQTVRLRPAPHCRTPILSYAMVVDHGTTGVAPFINWQQDPQSNHLARLVFPQPVEKFGVTVDLVAELSPINPFDFFLEEYAQEYGFKYDRNLAHDLTPYLACAQAPVCGPLFETYLATIDRTPRVMIDFLVDLNAGLQQHLSYNLRFDPGIQSPEHTLTQKNGSCRDYAWLLVQLLRRLGLAARFVSRATPSSSPPTTNPSIPNWPPAPPPASPRTSPTSTPGPKSFSPAPAGSASTPPAA